MRSRQTRNRLFGVGPEEFAMADILAEYLEAIKQGGITLARLVDRYPEAKEEIVPLLRLAVTLMGHRVWRLSKRHSPSHQLVI